jgi:hypothetical protein
MCSTTMSYVLLKVTMLYMCWTMCLKPIYVCIQLIIYATWCICDQCITYLFVGPLLMILHVWVFLFSDYSCCCHVKDMSCTEVKARISRKKLKNFNLSIFHHPFIVYGPNIPVISVGKLVKLTGNRFLMFINSKFKFAAIFNRFYWFSQ